MKNKGVKISLAIVGATVLYFIGRAIAKKGDKNSGNGGNGGNGGGDENDEPQNKPNPTLTQAIKNGTAVGKKIYTRVNNANIRHTAVVNNGWIDNIWATVPESGTYLGYIYDVWKSTDTRTINPNTNEPYNWIILNLDSSLWQKLNDDISILSPDKQSSRTLPCKVNKCSKNYWVREDIVKL
jgi:hypothetical protein